MIKEQMLKETPYGIARRYSFILDALSKEAKRHPSPLVIVDIGCGSGEFLTLPIASALQDKVEIYAFEPDINSLSHLVERASALTLSNIRPISVAQDLPENSFHVVILSEVLEHVEKPADFTKWIYRILKPEGILILTIPNGYGIFEIESLIFNILIVLGVINFLKRIRTMVRNLFGKPVQNVGLKDTFAISPHINFFTLSEIRQLLRTCDFLIERIEGKIFTAGPFSDRVLGLSPSFIRLNVLLGQMLPLSLVSDWMILARKVINPANGYNWSVQTGLYQRLKKYINLKATNGSL